jgi:thioredoxin 1
MEKELLHFTASWCQPCKRMEPIIEQFLVDNPDIKYTKVDVDVNGDIVAKNHVQSVPTFIVPETGKNHRGVATAAQLKELFA